MKVDVIIMAGAKNTGALRECCPGDYEALIEINGMPMVQYVVDAARQAKTVLRICVVGPVQVLEPLIKDKADILIESQGNLADNIFAGVKALGQQRKVLLLSSDVPLVSSEAIDKFVAQCEEREVDVYYPIISKEANLSKFPGTRRTYAHLKEGTYTGGNIAIINPNVIDGAADFIRKLIALRKAPLKLSQVFGITFILKFALGILSIAELEKRVYKITGFTAAALVVELPEIGFDVDKPSDLEMMRKYIIVSQ